MSINATLIGQMLVFALLVWFTMKFVWPILFQAIDDRQTKIADGLAAAEKGVHDLSLAEEKATQYLRDGKQKVSEMLAQAQKRADEIVEEGKTRGREEEERIVASARSQVEQEASQAREELKGQVSKLALIGAEQVLMREVDAAAHRDVLDKLAAQL